MGALETAKAGIRRPGERLRRLVGWVWYHAGARRLVFGAAATVVFVVNQLPLALGAGDPAEMVEASVVLLAVSVVLGYVTLGATWVLLQFWLFTLSVGVLRFHPLVEERWPSDNSTPEHVSSLGWL